MVSLVTSVWLVTHVPWHAVIDTFALFLWRSCLTVGLELLDSFSLVDPSHICSILDLRRLSLRRSYLLVPLDTLLALIRNSLSDPFLRVANPRRSPLLLSLN